METLATRDASGRITVMVWNAPLDQHALHGDQRLDRDVRVRVRVQVPAGTAYRVTHHRIDAAHSNIVAVWDRLRGTPGGPMTRSGNWSSRRTSWKRRNRPPAGNLPVAN